MKNTELVKQIKYNTLKSKIDLILPKADKKITDSLIFMSASYIIGIITGMLFLSSVL
jgi:hypothetical protein